MRVIMIAKEKNPPKKVRYSGYARYLSISL